MVQNEENPWQINQSQVVYDNPWICVTEHQVTNPAGNPGTYTVAGFKNYAIGIIPLDENNNTWLVGQYRFPLDIYSWEIPMGGGPKNKPWLTSAQQELLEETGLVAQDWQEIMTLHTSNSVTDEVGKVYLARNLRQEQAQPEETEVLQIKKLPFEEVYQMVLDGQITDAISVAGILKAKVLLDKH